MSDPKRPVDELFPTLKSWREEFTPGEFIPRRKSKDMIVYMSPDEFLDMAIPIESMDDLRYFGPFTGEKSIDAIHEITRLMRGGTEMDEVPKLGIDASDGRVQNHDGRHRANALKKLGYEKMPVRIQSLSSGGGVRWSEQRDPSLLDYNEDLPTQLISEDGTKTMDAPWETEGPNRGLPRAEYATDQPRDLPAQLLEEAMPARGLPMADDVPEDLATRIARQVREAVDETYRRQDPTDDPYKKAFRRANRIALDKQVPGMVRPGHSYYLHTVRTGSPDQAASVLQSIDEHGLFYRHYGESTNIRPFLLGPLGSGEQRLGKGPGGTSRGGVGTEYMAETSPSTRTYIVELPDDITHIDQVGERITPGHPLYETVAEARETRSPGKTGDRPLLKNFPPSDPSQRGYKMTASSKPWTGRLSADHIIGHIQDGILTLKPQIEQAARDSQITGIPREASSKLLEESVPPTGARAMARIEIIPERMEILVFEQGNPAPQGRLQLASLEEAADPDWARSLREMFPDLPEGMAGQAVKDVQLAEHLRGQGLGSKMYDAATELLEQKYPGGVFFAPSGSGAGATTPEAERVWGSLKTRRPTNGTGVYIGPERLTPPSFAKPSTQLLEESIPIKGAKAMATPLQKQLSPSEQRYFADILNNWADAEDLADAGLSLSDDGKTLYIADEDKAFRYLEDVYRTEMKPGGRGTSTLPRSFNDPDKFLRHGRGGYRQMGDLFTLHDEQAAEVRRLRDEIANLSPEDRRGYLPWQGYLEEDLEHAQKGLAKTQERLQASYDSVQEGRARSFRELEERYASTVAEPFIEEEVFGHEMETRRQEGQLRRGERAAGGRAARAARPSLGDLLQDEGIPRESFVDFVEIPENRRSGKSIPQLIQDYKIAGELPGSAGVPEGRSPRLYPPMTGEPTIHPPWEPDPHNISSGPSRENYRSVTPPEMTSQQKAFIAQDPASGLNIFTPTEVEAQWEGRPLSDDDLLMRGIDPQSPTGPQDEWNLMYGGDEGFHDPEFLRSGSKYPDYDYYVYDRETGGVLSGWEFAEDAQDALDEIEELYPGRTRLGSARAYKQKFGRIPSQSDWVEGSAVEHLEKTPSRYGWKREDVDDMLSRGMAPEFEGKRKMMVSGSNIPENQMTVSGRNAAPDAQKMAEQMSEAQKEHFRKQSKRVSEAIVNLRKMEQTEGVVTKLAKLRAAAAKAVPVLVALGDAAFVAELGWNIYKEDSIGGGVASTAATGVEGMGMIAQAPAALASLLPSHEERQEKGLLTSPEVAAEGLAAVGRGVSSTMKPYRRMRSREDRRAHYERQKAFYRELEPNLSESEIRQMAMRDVSGESTQEAIDDLQRRVSDRDVMMDGFPAQSGMMVENIRRSQERDRQMRERLPEGTGGMRQFWEGLEDSENAGLVGRVSKGAGLSTDLITPKRAGFVGRYSEPGLSAEEEADRAYQGSEQQKVDEARYRRAYLPGTRR